MSGSWSPARRAAYQEARRVQQRGKKEMEIRFCPECGEAKWTPESLRVHRWLKHDVREMPGGSGPFPDTR